MVAAGAWSNQIAGQLEAGFMLVGLYEDGWGGEEFPDAFFDGFIATRAVRPAQRQAVSEN